MKDDVINTNKLTADLQQKYPNSGIQSIKIDKESGESTLFVTPNKQNLAFLDKPGQAIKPHIFRESAATINRDFVSRQNLDLSGAKNPYEEDPHTLFSKASELYYTDPLLGSVTNVLASLAMKGFENDIDDENIKNFFDTWTFDVNFDDLLEWIFLDFFKVGHVTTYKVLAKYEPRVSHLSPVPGQKSKTNTSKGKEEQRLHKLHAKFDEDKDAAVLAIIAQAKASGVSQKELVKFEQAAKKNIWSKGHLPVSYTVLNPELVNVEGNLLFDNTSIKLTPPPELSAVLKKDKSELTEDEKALIKALPNELKKAAEGGGDFQLDSRLVGTVTYRKQPYERYARPRATRVFDTINYKQHLKNADLSTLDGISNYILKITIGNDEYPAVTQTELETIAQLFDTPSKSFDVVWNHTLEIEKIVAPEIEAILGQDKYKQVNEDMTGGLAVTRAIIDGTGDINTAEVGLLTKGIMEEINYARRQVSKWIYKEYRQIAEAMGFDRFPKIRWDESVLKDDILYMSTLSSLVDRRMLSYQTALEALGFDYTNELKNMEVELPLVEDGIFGLTGSPFQQSSTQPVQNSPSGTPSNGRPKGKPTTKTANIEQSKKAAFLSEQIDIIKSIPIDSWEDFISGAQETLPDEDYNKFLEEVHRIRFGGSK